MDNLRSLLLVEDNEDDVLLVRSVLEVARIRNPVHVASDFQQAISYLSGKGRYANREEYPLPVLVFLDLKLPGKSGHEILKWMQEQESLRDVLRVVLTGSEDPEDLRLCYQFGANCYFIKPLTVEQLTDPIRNLQIMLSIEK
jgi:CheY-like chemotaxis protein